MSGPILLLVLANVTPLVIVRPRRDPDESYTLFQLLFGVVDPVAAGWFLLLGVVGLLCVAAAITLRTSNGRTGPTAFVVAAAVGLLVVLLVLTIVGSAAGTKDVTVVVLTPATALGAAAAVWLIIGALSVRD